MTTALLLVLVTLVAVLLEEVKNVEGLQIGPLLSTCVDACQRGCEEIRKVHEQSRGVGGDGDGDGGLKVNFKDTTLQDPRSALTEADHASQRAIVSSLRNVWGDKLRIIGEEEETLGGEEASDTTTTPLRTDMFDDDLGDDTPEIDIDDITIYVDPLDGTREFVEGRLDSCTVLVGIAINGESVAGSIGIPFPKNGVEDDDNNAEGDEKESPTIVYGLVGLGSGVIGAPLTRGPFPLERNIDGIKKPRPHHATGDSTEDVLIACKDAAIKKFGGSNVIYGGAGNKILAASLGEVTCCIQHKVGGPWDICAPEAIVKSMGATITDLFGKDIEIYYHPTKNPNPPDRCNERGFVVSAPGLQDNDQFHTKLINAINASPIVQQYRESLQPLDAEYMP